MLITRIFTIVLVLLSTQVLIAQEEVQDSLGKTPVFQTFKDTRVLNSHSVETLPARKLDIRIGHRFGDMFGDAGGWASFYGLEEAADVVIGGEYGITDGLMIGLSRAKGAGDLRQLVSGVIKLRLLRQYEENPNSWSVTALGVINTSTMPSAPDSTSLAFFNKFSHRMSYTAQLLIGQKFSDNFSLQFTPSYTHRNLVKFDDTNDIFSVGVAARIQLTRVIGLIADVTLPLNGEQSPIFKEGTSEEEFFAPIGIGFEFDTGGHVFQVNLTNARGLTDPDYITSTKSDWIKGQFRLGFTISRLFNIR